MVAFYPGEAVQVKKYGREGKASVRSCQRCGQAFSRARVAERLIEKEQGCISGAVQ